MPNASNYSKRKSPALLVIGLFFTAMSKSCILKFDEPDTPSALTAVVFSKCTKKDSRPRYFLRWSHEFNRFAVGTGSI